MMTEEEYRATLDRIQLFQRQVERLRKLETNAQNYRLSAGGYLAELDKMQLEVRDYLWTCPAELVEPSVQS